MKVSRDESADLARGLMNEFAEQTGLKENKGLKQDRYLWTDAFAVQNFLALSSYFDNDRYTDFARGLIDQVHYTLGRFAPDDSRSGWISQLPETAGRKHPTVNGLRIGKKQLERKESEPFDPNMEWNKDGQYYHYHTRWINALLKAAEFLDSDKLIKHAAELSLAGSHFLQKKDGRLHLHWKMSIDLSYPQVVSMGAHDPLDGYLTALECKMIASDNYDFTEYIDSLKTICRGKNWQTSDPLGLGGLLLNAIRTAKLERHTDLPQSIGPKKLLADALRGLDAFENQTDLTSSGKFRLAFRECGLSLGLRVAARYRDLLVQIYPEFENIDKRLNLAEQIEDFWSKSQNREFPSYRDHLNINHVSLSSSLLARAEPKFFSSPRIGDSGDNIS